MKLAEKLLKDRIIYNHPLKEEFLSRYEGSTARAYARTFIHSNFLEEKLDRDLATFTDDELDLFVREHLQPTTVLSAKASCRALSQYLKFAIEKGLRETNVFYVNEKEYAKYATVEQVDLIPAMDIDDITMVELNNANDALIIRLVFEGALGYQLSEIANLTVNDIDEDTNTITLHDDDKKKRANDNYKRELVVSNGTMELIRSAMRERIYLKKNGKMDESNPRIKTEVELVDSPYVLRPTKTSNNSLQDEGKLSRSTLYYRIRVVSEVEALQMVNASWNTKNIQRSGMLWQALKIIQKKGKLEKSDYNEIAKRFGIADNWHNRFIINLDTIKEVYGDNYMDIDTENF